MDAQQADMLGFKTQKLRDMSVEVEWEEVVGSVVTVWDYHIQMGFPTY